MKHITRRPGKRTRPSQNGAPGLLRLPLEVRHNIYQYFLKADKIARPSQHIRSKSFSLEILSVNRQIRAEAWDYLCRANTWIKLVIPSDFHDATLAPTKWTIPMTIPKIFPKADLAFLCQHRMLTIYVKDPKTPEHQVREAVRYTAHYIVYNKFSWFSFVTSAKLSTYNSFTVEFAPKYINNHTGLSDIYLPLMTIRGASTVRIPGLEEQPLFKAAIRNMTKKSCIPQNGHDLVLGLKEEGDFYRSNSELCTALFFYEIASAQACMFLKHPEHTQETAKTSEWNALRAISVDILNSRLSATNHVLDTMKQDGQLVPEAASFVQYQLATAITLRQWPVMTDSQRMYYHYQRGRAYLHAAEYYEKPENMNYMREHNFTPRAISPNELFQTAAKNFYYAWALDNIKAQPALRFWQMISNKLGQTEELKGHISVEYIAGYGQWRGDKSLWSGWKMVAHIPPEKLWTTVGDLQVTGPNALEAMRKELDFHWRDGPAGLLRVLAP